VNLLDTFRIGNARPLPEFKEPPAGLHLNLGAGKKMIPGVECILLDAERGWMAGQRMPLDDESVAQVYAFHFLEHLTKAEIILVFRELERVLVPGGLVNLLVPHWRCELAYQDLDHKSFWSERTLHMLLEDTSYDGTMPRDWRLKIVSVALIGIVERNTVVVQQLERV
jgi:SAM-dependent methyltransferase